MALHAERLARARLSLEGLSVGDGFGDRFFLHPDFAHNLISKRAVPAAPWRWTDDTNMALSIYQNIRQHREINQDKLAKSFALHYAGDRGYGAGMHSMLANVLAGDSWQTLAPALFSGQGSHGNGAAMRVAPLGAYFADDLDALIENVRRSAEVTHAHPEGIAGAIAVALAAAYAWRLQGTAPPERSAFIDLVLSHLPESEVRSRLRRASEILPQASAVHAGAMLGNGSQISAQDTVPFALWCAAEYLTNYEEAIWQTISAGGDVDTTCAMVGGVVALFTGEQGIPQAWRDSREPLPTWAFED